jgi:hypothetical protein
MPSNQRISSNTASDMIRVDTISEEFTNSSVVNLLHWNIYAFLLSADGWIYFCRDISGDLPCQQTNRLLVLHLRCLWFWTVCWTRKLCRSCWDCSLQYLEQLWQTASVVLLVLSRSFECWLAVNHKQVQCKRSKI